MIPEATDLLLITLKYLHMHDQLALQPLPKLYPSYPHGNSRFPLQGSLPNVPFPSVSLKLKALSKLTFAPSLMDIADAFFVV